MSDRKTAGAKPAVFATGIGLMRIAALIVLALAVPAAQAAAAAPKTFEVASKVGRSNVRFRAILHPQAAACSAAQIKTLRAKVLAEGEAHMRTHLKEVIAKSKTDASAPNEFFGLSYLVGCPPDGGAWVAFPAQGPNKAVSRFSPAEGWSPMAPL
ncbi:MAG TPA: hypothetical protein VGC51_08760 [Hansschlegelia sp.]